MRAAKEGDAGARAAQIEQRRQPILDVAHSAVDVELVDEGVGRHGQQAGRARVVGSRSIGVRADVGHVALVHDEQRLDLAVLTPGTAVALDDVLSCGASVCGDDDAIPCHTRTGAGACDKVRVQAGVQGVEGACIQHSVEHALLVTLHCKAALLTV